MYSLIARASSRSLVSTTKETRAISFYSTVFHSRQLKLNKLSERHLWIHHGSFFPKQIRFEKRCLSSLSNRIWDIVQSGSFNPGNPLIENIKQLTGLNESSTNLNSIDFSRIQPHHLVDATTQIQVEYENELSKLEEDIKNGTCEDLAFIEKLHSISFPLFVIENVLHLLCNVQTDPTMVKSCTEALNSIRFRHETSMIIVEKLRELEKKLSSAGDAEQSLIVEHLLMRSKNRGVNFESDPVVRGGEEMDKETFQQYLVETERRIVDVEKKFLSLSQLSFEKDGRSASPKDLLPLMYEIAILKGAKAKLLGYESFGELSMKSTTKRTVKEYETVKTLHEFLSGIIHPKLSPKSDTNILDEMLALRKDESLMDLKQYFNLSAVLLCLFDLSQSLFGVNITEESNKSLVRGWNDDVRLFYVNDAETGDRIASFYLDPFKRRDKTSGAFVAPIVFRHKNDNSDTFPALAICLDINPPAWDDSPVHMSLEDVTTLFHEFGHALQHMLASSKFGTFAGAHCIESDATEVVSQFMEYLVYEKSVLAIIARNTKGDTLPDEIVSKLQQKRTIEKCYELSHRIFLSQLELEIFSNFDPNGDESIIALQSRLTGQFLHYDPPPKGNIDPLIEIFQNNAKGKNVAQYRYLWSEVMSADAYDYLTYDEGKYLKVNGMKFKEAFLNGAGSKPTEESFQKFRCREPFLEPFIKMLKIE